MPNKTIEALAVDARSHDCPFCAICAGSAPFDPISQPPAAAKGQEQAHIVLSTPDIIAFLDILPLTRGHVLVCPRTHSEKLTHLSPAQNAMVGAWLPVIARAACRVSGYEDFNVVQNNGVNAAQVVPHVHYHIIPRPDERQREQLESETPGIKKRWWKSPFGSGWRTDLSDEEGAQLAAAMRAEVCREVKKMRQDPKGKTDARFLASL